MMQNAMSRDRVVARGRRAMVAMQAAVSGIKVLTPPYLGTVSAGVQEQRSS
jgi:hypothetical protein